MTPIKTDLKTIRQYRILVVGLSQGIYWKSTTGYQVVIPGFEEFKFFVNKAPSGWSLSEESTGFAFPPEEDFPTRQKAIDNAIGILRQLGKTGLLRTMDEVKSYIPKEKHDTRRG